MAANELSAKEGDDFVFNDQTVVFQPGDTQATRQFVIIDDAVEENVEFATVALTSTDGNVVIGTPGTTTINIEDNDGTFILFSECFLFLLEGVLSVFTNFTGNAHLL